MEKYELEYTVLAYLIEYAARSREIIRRAAISPEMFEDDKCRAAFIALMDEETDDKDVLTFKASKLLPEVINDTDKYQVFSGFAANIGALEYDLHRFTSAALRRELLHNRAMGAAYAPGIPIELYLENEEDILLKCKAKAAAISAALFNPETAAPIDSEILPATDPQLLSVPGFINELVDYSMRAAHRPNRVLAFTGALSMLAHLAGRKFIGPRDCQPNLYLIALASSGVGKDFPQRVNRTIAHLERLDVSIVSSIASGQGLEDAILRSPALLCQIDEFDTVLELLKSTKNSNQATEALWSVLLRYFSSSGSTQNSRSKAAGAKGNDSGIPIYYPSVSLYASAIPSRFYSALTERACTNGLVGRCLVFEAGERGEANLSSGEYNNPVSPLLRRMVSNLANTGARSIDNRPIENRDLIEVTYGEGAENEVAKINHEVDILYNTAHRRKDEMQATVWNRSVELIIKLALLYAISESLPEMTKPVISLDAVKWAWKLVKSLQLRMIAMIEEYLAVDENEQNVKKVLRIIRDASKRGISRQELLKKAHLMAEMLDKIENTLLDRGEIRVDSLPSSKNGKPRKHYYVLKKK